MWGHDVRSSLKGCPSVASPHPILRYMNGVCCNVFLFFSPDLAFIAIIFSNSLPPFFRFFFSFQLTPQSYCTPYGKHSSNL